MADGEQQDARRQRGGRSQRREARVGVEQGTHRPYIQRGIPTYDILSDESLTAIEATADRLLAEIGIELREDAEAMRLYRQAGAKVTEQTEGIWRIRFEPGMLREVLKTAPAEFTQHARNPANSVRTWPPGQPATMSRKPSRTWRRCAHRDGVMGPFCWRTPSTRGTITNQHCDVLTTPRRTPQHRRVS